MIGGLFSNARQCMHQSVIGHGRVLGDACGQFNRLVDSPHLINQSIALALRTQPNTSLGNLVDLLELLLSSFRNQADKGLVDLLDSFAQFRPRRRCHWLIVGIDIGKLAALQRLFLDSQLVVEAL